MADRGGDSFKVSLAQDRRTGSHAGVDRLGVFLDSILAQMGQQPRIFPGGLLAEVSCGLSQLVVF